MLRAQRAYDTAAARDALFCCDATLLLPSMFRRMMLLCRCADALIFIYFQIRVFAKSRLLFRCHAAYELPRRLRRRCRGWRHAYADATPC